MAELIFDNEDLCRIDHLVRNLEGFNSEHNPFSFPITEDNIVSAYLNLKRRGIITRNEKYPLASDGGEVKRFFNFLTLVGATEKYSDLSIFNIMEKNTNNRIGISLNNACQKACKNCASDAKPNGEQTEFRKITNLDERFLSLFQSAGFGLEGEPFFYSSEEKNLGDVIEFLSNYGIKEFDILTGGFFKRDSIYEKTIDKLIEVKENREIKIDIEMTYNHYISNLKRNEESLKYTLEQISRLTPEMSIKVLGDPSEGITNINNTIIRLDKLLTDDGFTRNNISYLRNGFKISKVTASFSLRVGRYKGEEPENNEIQQLCGHLGYEEWFIDYKGGVFFCPSVMAYDKEKVANVYEKEFDKSIEELEEYHKKNYNWLKNNLRKIMIGEKPSCMCLRGSNCE